MLDNTTVLLPTDYLLYYYYHHHHHHFSNFVNSKIILKHFVHFYYVAGEFKRIFYNKSGHWSLIQECLC
jgi:hypothetical protein